MKDFKELDKRCVHEVEMIILEEWKKQDIIDSKLFGDGEENEIFDSALGDYIAIAENSNKCLLVEGDELLISQHAGYTDDEIYVPLITKTTVKKLTK